MSAKRKKDSGQPELPIEGAQPGRAGGNQKKTPPANGNGADHVVAEVVETIVHKPFDPKKLEAGLHTRVDRGFLDYASYVIRDRAIPNLADGLKPVQRRILWALHEKDDGRSSRSPTSSATRCNIIRTATRPSATRSWCWRTSVISSKGQGNFGNIFTGDPAAAPRYIECRLTELARTEVFNDSITDFIPSYDGRNKEPVTLPCKLPLNLMLGTEGIAVGLSARILPHNFPELLEAQIAILKKQPFKCLPDFPTGGLMDARDYQDGKGSVKVRAKIKTKDESTVVIKEIPPTTTTESLIASIEDAVQKGKLKVKSINDFTSETVEIEIKCPRAWTRRKWWMRSMPSPIAKSPSPAASSSSRTTGRWN
jgi:topoisomerase-4 subunit A